MVAMIRFKQWLRNNILDVAYLISYLKANILRTTGQNSVLILPGADGWDEKEPHSFGDEMLLLGALNGLHDRGFEKIAILRMDGYANEVALVRGIPVKVLSFSKGWLTLTSYSQFIKWASSCSHFVVIGADVMDGAYSQINTIQRLRFVKLASAMGLTTVITGCSFNGTQDKEICNSLVAVEKAGTIINARDLVSYDRFRVFLKNVKSVTDLAFSVDSELYSIMDSIKEVRKQAALWKEQAGIVVGINLCGWNINNKDFFFDEFIAALLQLDNSSHKLGLILIPHDTRVDKWSDLDTLVEFRQRLGDRVKIIGTPYDIQSGIDAKQAVLCCDVVLTGRMHLAIAALDQEVPAVSFGYQGKFEGLYGLFGMGAEWLVEYENPVGAIKTLSLAIGQRQELSKVIKGHLQGVRDASLQNFNWLGER